ncbi:MAG: type II secretion system secretin GspD [Thiotrichales bacterium]
MSSKFRTWLLSAFLVIQLLSTAHAKEAVTLNLKDADIRVLIDTVAEVTEKNFIIDPRVKAKVTVVSTNPMEAGELYEIFLSILQVHGFSAVPVGDVIKIVPDVNAKQGPVPTVDQARRSDGDQLVTRVVPINHVPAAQLVPILRPLIPQQGQLAAYQPSNILLISDRAANVDRLVKIISRIDRPDQSDIEIIRLQNAPAADVARTLSTLQQKDAKGGVLPGQPSVTADERTNSILLSGDKSTRLRLRGIIAHLDTPIGEGGDTQVVFLKYAQAEDLVQILTGVSKSNAKSKTVTSKVKKAGASSGSYAGRNDVNIQADVTNNAIVITAPPSVQQELRQVIAQLDIRRAQVLVEAIVAEVRLELAKELGTSFAAYSQDSQGDANGPAIVTNLGSLTTTVLSAVNGAIPSNLNGMLIGGGDTGPGKTNFAILLKALAQDAATNILSTPTLVTLDNVEAEITVGQEVPFVTGQFSNTGSTTSSVNPFQTIERKDVGLTLKLKPQINEGDAVQLEIEQESSSLAASASGVNASDVITNKRTIKTSVLAQDGQVIVLGGLIDDSYRDTREKVPLLGDIPVLGNLFRFNGTSKTKQSLMVFIRPVILRDAETANAYTERKYSYFRDRQLDAKIQDRGLIRDSAGVIPDLDELVTQLPDDSGLIEQFGSF